MASVVVPPLPHVPELHPPAPHPTYGTATAGPVFIWYTAMTAEPPVAPTATVEAVVIVYELALTYVMLYSVFKRVA
jgi:hypothetical protein